MPDDKIENFNEHRLRKVVNDLETDKDIIKFARWVNDHVTDEFTLTSDYGMSYNLEVHTKKNHKDIIRDILKTVVDKNGYYTPPYE